MRILVIEDEEGVSTSLKRGLEADGFAVDVADYLRKPFSYIVLLARIRNLIRRTSGPGAPDVLSVGDLVLDPSRHTCHRGGEAVELSPRAMAVLEFLMRNAGSVVAKDEILRHVWDRAFEGDPNIVEVYVSRIRGAIDSRAADIAAQVDSEAEFISLGAGIDADTFAVVFSADGAIYDSSDPGVDVEMLLTTFEVSDTPFNTSFTGLSETAGSDNMRAVVLVVPFVLDAPTPSDRIEDEDFIIYVATSLDGLDRTVDRVTVATATATALRADSDRMSRLVGDLLLLARSDDPGEAATQATNQLVDADDIVAEALRETRCPAGIAIDVDAVSGAVVRGNPDELRRLMSNLLTNATRHATSRVGLTVSESNGNVVLSLSDDGPGIGEADRERIFDRFVRLDEARARDDGGSGLGLAISRDIVRRHSGHIRVDESTSGGSQFSVHLPSA